MSSTLTTALRGLRLTPFLPIRPSVTLPSIPSRPLSTTSVPLNKMSPQYLAAKGLNKKSKAKNNAPRQPNFINMLRHLAVLSPRRIPAPLRMARNRYLRHWTIHRAWLMYRRKEREAREKVWMRQYQSMNHACEELRLTSGPGSRDEGSLFRTALEKWGVYGLKGVPIEYTRAQTETPARVAWNHDWKR
ncbi:hypothetical protein QBC35DRAFT_485113 [Podospora australis]|uniref:Large ribosomal subunit protein mL40 n=1 Tax=Podospora australis TaxID=1536484 RepID=A0AAN6X2Y5_9PEZI|nr:hypothetical protein QBC35DRAFT_485113 [Podospora australis]